MIYKYFYFNLDSEDSIYKNINYLDKNINFSNNYINKYN